MFTYFTYLRKKKATMVVNDVIIIFWYPPQKKGYVCASGTGLYCQLGHTVLAHVSQYITVT